MKTTMKVVKIMKKYTSILLIFIFFTINIIPAFAQTTPNSLSQGIYNVRDTNLLIHTPLTAKITPSTGSIILIVINSNQTIEALVRLNSEVSQQTLPPLDYNYSLIVYGSGSVILS